MVALSGIYHLVFACRVHGYRGYDKEGLLSEIYLTKDNVLQFYSAKTMLPNAVEAGSLLHFV